MRPLPRGGAVWTASGWLPYEGGQYNVALYPPGEPCDAFPGSPVYPFLWTAVWWYPGRPEHLASYLSEGDARTDLQRSLAGGRIRGKAVRRDR